MVELTEQSIVGLTGGWISSMSASRSIVVGRKQFPKMMKTLGYVPHPGLPGGRATKIVPFDAGKPKLYIKKGHISSGLTNPDDVMRAFIKSQNEGITNATGFPVHKM